MLLVLLCYGRSHLVGMDVEGIGCEATCLCVDDDRCACRAFERLADHPVVHGCHCLLVGHLLAFRIVIRRRCSWSPSVADGWASNSFHSFGPNSGDGNSTLNPSSGLSPLSVCMKRPSPRRIELPLMLPFISHT